MSKKGKLSSGMLLFYKWQVAPENARTVNRWKKKWYSTKSVDYRNELGFSLDEKGIVHGGYTFLKRRTKAETFLLNIYSFNTAQHEAKVFMRALKKDRTPEKMKRMSGILNARDEFAAAACHIVSRNLTSTFFQSVADLLEHTEQRRPFAKAEASQQAAHIKILRAFDQLIEKLGRLPDKSELELEATGRVSEKDESQRRQFNRQLEQVGLDGLPERPPTTKRTAGPVQSKRKSKVDRESGEKMTTL